MINKKILFMYVLKAIDIAYNLICFLGVILTFRSSLLLLLLFLPIPALAFIFGFTEIFWDIDLPHLIVDFLDKLNKCNMESSNGEFCKFMYDMQK